MADNVGAAYRIEQSEPADSGQKLYTMVVSVSVGAESSEEAACRLGRMMEAALDVGTQAGARVRWGDPEHCGDGVRLATTEALDTVLLDEAGRPKTGALIFVVGHDRDANETTSEGWE